MHLVDIDNTKAAVQAFIEQLREDAASAIQVEKDSEKSANLSAQRQGAEAVLDMLEKAPVVTNVEMIVYGEWITIKPKPRGRTYYQCSVCKSVFTSSALNELSRSEELPARCPHCAARLQVP